MPHDDRVRAVTNSDSFPRMLDTLGEQVRRTATANNYILAKVTDLRTELGACVLRHTDPRSRINWESALSQYTMLSATVFYEFYREELAREYPPETLPALPPAQEELGVRLIGLLDATDRANIPEILHGADGVDAYFTLLLKNRHIPSERTPPLALIMYRMPNRSAMLRAGVMAKFLDMMARPAAGEEVSLNSVMRFLDAHNHFNYIRWAETREQRPRAVIALLTSVANLTNGVLSRAGRAAMAGTPVDVDAVHNELMSVLCAVIIAGILWENRDEAIRTMNAELLMLPGAAARADDVDEPPPALAGGCHGHGGKKKGKHGMR
jgi:hypothetical protein